MITKPINNDVHNDIFQTALCITLRGQVMETDFKLLQDGINRVKRFIHSENYNIERAISNAAKAAYFSKLIEKGVTQVQHFDIQNSKFLANSTIVSPLNTKLNKLKKSNIEAFFYWNEIQKLENM